MTKTKTHKKRAKPCQVKKVKRPEVIVSIPKNAKLTIHRKAHNPYMMDVTDSPQGTTTHHKWYSDDYDPTKGGM